MGNEASIAAGALQAKAKMSQALDSVGETLKGEPAAKNPKDYGKMHQKREREFEERNAEKAHRMSELKEKWAANKKMQAKHSTDKPAFSVNKLSSGKVEEEKKNWWAK